MRGRFAEGPDLVVARVGLPVLGLAWGLVALGLNDEWRYAVVWIPDLAVGVAFFVLSETPNHVAGTT